MDRCRYSVGIVVRIQQVSSALPWAFFQLSQIAANPTPLAFVDFETVRPLRFTYPLPLVEHLRSNQALRDFSASPNAGFVQAVSDLALIIFTAIYESLADDGMSSQRTNESSRTGSFGPCLMMGRSCLGAMLYRGSSFVLLMGIGALFNHLLPPL